MKNFELLYQCVQSIKNCSPESVEYQVACNEVYKRIIVKLNAHAKNLCKGSHMTRGKEYESILVQESLLKFAKSIATFNLENERYKDEKVLLYAIIKFHTKTIYHDFLNLIKKLENEGDINISFEEVDNFSEPSTELEDQSADEVEEIDLKYELLAMAFKELDTYDKEVLLALFQFHKSIIPDDIWDKLCTEFGASRESLRQTKCRALKQMRKILDA